MNGIQNFELDIYHKQGEKTYLTLKDTPLIPNNLIKLATHAITSINDEMYMYVLIGEGKENKAMLVISRETILGNSNNNAEIARKLKKIHYFR